MTDKENFPRLDTSIFRNYELNLPYVGKEQIEDNVRCVTIGKDKDSFSYNVRPDYSAFKQKIYNTENDCVCVLVGFIHPNKVYELYQKKEDEWRELYDHSGAVTVASFEEQRWVDVHKITGLLLDIKKMIEIGIASQEIGTVLEQDNIENLNKMTSQKLFSSRRHFHSLSFLKWAQKNSFPIPDELKFHENMQGQLEYVDTVLYGDLKQTFPEHPTGKEKNKDPLYIAVKVREAMMEGLIKKTNARTLKQAMEQYIKTEYRFLSEAKQRAIVSLVNDGKGHGGVRR